MTRRPAAAAPTTIEVALTEAPYPVVVGEGMLAELTDLLPIPDGAGRALVVTQDPIDAAGHVEPVEVALAAGGLDVRRHTVPDGEAAKSVEVLAQLWDTCAQLPLGRGDLIVAVGGGVVGDLAGFVAATWNRGVAVWQVPTTLLAQVDAAIGGKTGINLAAGKNLVGAFHQPRGVLCDLDTLATLPPRIRTEGFGEVVKYGLIADPVILERLEAEPSLAKGSDPAAWRELVERSVAVKARVVAADEREGGIRAHLNLGHTYGHVVEALTGYAEVLHGEGVAIGTVVALHLGARLGRTPAELVARGEAAIDALGLPTRGPRLDRDDVWRTIARDKKVVRDRVRFVVLDDLAVPAVVPAGRDDLEAVLDALGS